MSLQRRVTVSDASAIGAARRAAAQMAAEAQADETQSGRIAIVASELATNLALHARGGELLLQVLDLGDSRVMELLSIDGGPGMEDPQRCLADGYSTAGTPGNGLGAIRRLSAAFDLYSQPGKGTVIVSRLPLLPVTGHRAPSSKLEFGAISLPLQGETACGDAWRHIQTDREFSLMLVDGLGHGILASDAAGQALAAFEVASRDPSRLLHEAHRRMAPTRGGAVACALVDRVQGKLSYAGIGNISGTLLGGTRHQGLVSHNGTVGAQIRRIQAFEYSWTGENLLVMHSDGVSARWKLADYPGLVGCHPALIAAVLYRDHGRARDDSTVAVVRLLNA
jgi:anti-sigma regulatory factor (Ser/Thr protein kinase)